MHRWFLVSFLLASSTRVAAEPASLVGPFTRTDYPRAVIDRPLTLPAGMVEGEIGAQFSSLTIDDPDLGLVAGADDWVGDVTLRVGVLDRLQLEAGTSFSLDHRQTASDFQGVEGLDFRPTLTSWQRVVPLRLSFLALDTAPLDTAVTLTLPFQSHTSRLVYFGRAGKLRVQNGNGRVLPAVALAAPTRWRLTNWLWLRAGEDLFLVGTKEGDAAFSFVFGVGVQPLDFVAVTLDSRIASVAFDGGGSLGSVTIADYGTIDLEGTFSPVRWFDVVGGLALPNVGSAFDDYVLRVGARVRF